MKIILKVCLGLLSLSLFLNAYDVNSKVLQQEQFENNTVYLPVNNYRTLEFNTRIKSIQLTNSENIIAEFIENDNKPLQILKVLGKNVGNESAIVTLESGKTIQVNFNIMQNLDSIISIVKLTYPNLIVEQANDTIVLKGYVKDYKEKDLVLDIFKKAGISVDEKLVDMIETSTPSKMIRVKLYAVEINNDDGIDLKNNWVNTVRNNSDFKDGDTYTFVTTDSRPDSITQSNVDIMAAIDGILANAISLTGGLTSAANYLSEFFNTSLILQYLESEGVANILDETTLITLENKEASFHAGGTIRLKTQTTTSEGIPTSTVEKVRYGLQLTVKAKNVMKDGYVDLEITTSNTKIDWTNQVDDIPSFLENEVTTNVLAKNGATIVLGGLVNNENSNDIEKVPALGDIPILGFLFTSKSFKEGRSELVFFLTPEIVDPASNDQTTRYKDQRKQMLDTSKFKDEEEEEELLKKEESDIAVTTDKEVVKTEKKAEPKEKKTLLDYFTN